MSAQRDVAELFDRQDVLEVMYRYCRAADTGDLDLMLSCFVPDCAVSLFIDPDRLIHGTVGLRNLLAPLLGKVVAGSHYITNPEFTRLAADEAHLHVYMFSAQRHQPELNLADRYRYGRYELQFQRKAEGWRIRTLRLFAVTEQGGDRFAENADRAWPPTFASIAGD